MSRITKDTLLSRLAMLNQALERRKAPYRYTAHQENDAWVIERTGGEYGVDSVRRGHTTRQAYDCIYCMWSVLVDNTEVPA